MTPQKIYGLIGYPVSHSLSPRMHNAAFAHLKINAEYKLFPLQEEEIGTFLRNLKTKNIHGLNVTVPYKEKVIPFLNSISDEASLIGAVNTIRCSGDSLEGFNTDGQGFLRHLTEDLKFAPKGKNIFLLGAGGAAKAVAVSLCKESPRKLAILDIDAKKASSLAEQLEKNFKGIEIRLAQSAEEIKTGNAQLLVNATSIGMKDSDSLLVAPELLDEDMFVYDVIYNPDQTKLLKSAKERRAKAANGLGMLLYQGAIAFEIWTGKAAPVGVMRKALMEGSHT